MVKPAVGSLNDWRKHEFKNTNLKNHIKGMHLNKKYNNMLTKNTTYDGNSTANTNLLSDSRFPMSQ